MHCVAKCVSVNKGNLFNRYKSIERKQIMVTTETEAKASTIREKQRNNRNASK